MIPETLDLCRTGSPSRIPQPGGEWPIYGEPAEQNYRMQWSNDAVTLERLVRAGMDHPGAFTIIHEDQVVVCDARVEPDTGSSPGTILDLSDHGMQVPTGRRYDMTDLINDLNSTGQRVVAFPIQEYWIDIGKLENYKQAQADLCGSTEDLA